LTISRGRAIVRAVAAPVRGRFYGPARERQVDGGRLATGNFQAWRLGIAPPERMRQDSPYSRITYIVLVDGAGCSLTPPAIEQCRKWVPAGA
jgi:hypothetical protein